MTEKELYAKYSHEVGKDVVKTVAFFFVGLPLILFVLACFVTA